MSSMTLDAVRPLRPLPAAFVPLALALLLVLSTLPLGRTLSPPAPTPTDAEWAAPLAGAGSVRVGALPLGLQYAISTSAGRADPAYHLAPAGAGHRAANPAQGLAAQIDGATLAIQDGELGWSVGLASWGRGERQQPVGAVGAPEATANRLELDYGGINAWYANGPLGVQQGWTLAARPDGPAGAPLVLRLATTGPAPAIAADGRGLTVADAAGAPWLRYAGLQAFDAAGRPLEARFVPDGSGIAVQVDDSGAVYPLTVDPWVQRATLSATQAAEFGGISDAALSADGSTVFALVRDRTIFDPEEGWYAYDGYVYQRPAGGWASATETARLTGDSSDETTGLYPPFAISPDGSTIVSGATDRGILEPDATVRETAYVYERPAGGWADAAPTAILTTSDLASRNRFDDRNTAVVISADSATIALGRAFDAVVSGGEFRGSVYVYERPAGGWADASETAKLLPPTSFDRMEFGQALSIDADGSTIAASSNQADFDLPWEPVIYLFERPAGGWAPVAAPAELTLGPIPNLATIPVFIGLAMSADGTTMLASSYISFGGTPGLFVFNNVFVRPGAAWADTTDVGRLSASDNASLFFYDITGGGIRALNNTVSADGSRIVLLAEDGTRYSFNRPSGGWTSMTESAKTSAPFGEVSTDGSTLLSVDGAEGVALVYELQESQTITLLPDADSRVRAGSPNRNYGSDRFLRVDGEDDPRESMLRFVVSGLEGQVQRATLRLWAYSSNRNGPALYAMGNNWDEATITWNNRPARTGGIIDNAGRLPRNAWTEYDVTAAIQADGTYSFVLVAETTEEIEWSSSEGWRSPELVIETVGP